MADRRKTFDLDLAAAAQRNEAARPSIIPVSKDTEIVEKGGLKMKRRKTSAAPAAAAPAPPLKTPYEQLERGASNATQRTPNVEEYEISAELYERLSQNLHALPEGAPAAERLLAVVGAVAGAEVEILSKSGDTQLVAAADAVFAGFLASLQTAAAGGAVQFAAPPSSPALGDADLKVDLEARKAGLRNRLKALKQEEEEWNTLLAKVEELDVGGASGGAGEEEEAGPSSADAAQRYAGEELAALAAVQADVAQALTLQVDAAEQLVGAIQDVLDRADATAAEAHAAHHAKRFQAFAHVNSPKVLIKKIMMGGA